MRRELAREHGRVDALGGAFNVVFGGALGIEENLQDLISPVSYPHLWDAGYTDRVQWNGFNHNGGYGRLGRNVGQVTGVWTDIDMSRTGPLVAYPSTVRVAGMVDTEEQLRKLRSPAWPEKIFGPLDPDRHRTLELGLRRQDALDLLLVHLRDGPCVGERRLEGEDLGLQRLRVRGP